MRKHLVVRGVGVIVLIAIIAAVAGGKGKAHQASAPTAKAHVSPRPAAAVPSRQRSTGIPRTTPCQTQSALAVGADTSCPFAQEVLKSYASASQQAPDEGAELSIEAWSPTTRMEYSMRCAAADATESSQTLIVCRGGDQALVTFPESAAAAARAQATEGSQESSEEGLQERSEEGVDEVGSPSHAGDQQFCEEHQCIGEFTTEDGNVAECADGTFSHAGGISGACSDHGGVARE